MKKILLFLMVLGVSISAMAVTVDDLMKWGGYAIENSRSDRSYGQPVRWLSSSTETKFEKVNDTTIRLTGMLDDEYEFTFTLGNNYTLAVGSGSPSTDGTQLVLHGNNHFSTNKSNYYLCPIRFNSTYNDYDSGTNNNVVGTITPMENGGYKISFGSVALRNRYDQGVHKNVEWYDTYELEVFEPNATIKDDVYDWYNDKWVVRNRVMPARFDFNDDGSFTMKGFHQLGYAIDENDNLVPFTGEFVNYDDVIMTTNHILFAEEIRSGLTVSWGDYYLNGMDPADWSSANPTFYEYAWGKVSSSDRPEHSGVTTWVTNDGDCRTKVGTTMTFDPYVTISPYGSNAVGTTLINPVSVNTVVDLSQDVTHDVELEFEGCNVLPGIGVHVFSAITPGKKGVENVDEEHPYDVFLVEGKHSSINDVFFVGKTHADKGHEEAICLTPYIRQDENQVSARADGQPSLIVNNMWIPMADLPSKKVDKDDQYTIFVRTNYKPSTGLAPTFHSMQTLSPQIVLGVDAAEVDAAAVSIVAGNGMITVTGAETVQIYALDGREVYNGTAGEIPLGAGFYTVRAASKTAKVIVR